MGAVVAPEPALAEVEADSDSDGKSKMSFSYWGADKLSLQAPPSQKQGNPSKSAVQTRRGGNAPTSYVSAFVANDGLDFRLTINIIISQAPMRNLVHVCDPRNQPMNVILHPARALGVDGTRSPPTLPPLIPSARVQTLSYPHGGAQQPHVRPPLPCHGLLGYLNHRHLPKWCR